VSFYLIIVLLSFGDGCKSTGTDPIISSRFKGNILFAGNWGHDQVYIVDIDSNKIVDSIKGFGAVWNLAITHSKSKLYVSTREGPENSPGAAYSVDLNTGKISFIISKANILCISPSGDPFIFISTPYDSLKQVGIIDTVTDHISIIDTLNILDSGAINNIVAFNSSKTILYSLNNMGNIFVYDYKKRAIVNTFPFVGIPLNILISRDNTKLFVASYTYGLIALDLSQIGILNEKISSLYIHVFVMLEYRCIFAADLSK
jgi:6-phosphogluconolactonase (cycloisomerase 2 family)